MTKLKQEYHQMAGDLGYDRETHRRIERATNRNELCRIMHDARNRTIDAERKQKQINRDITMYAERKELLRYAG